MKALVVGGTGPTGPHIVRGLLARGYEVTIFHRGIHEPPDLPDVEHIHADPHFAETIADGLGQRSWDLAIVTYGRLLLLAEALAGRCDRFISVGGIPTHIGVLSPDKLRPFGMRIPTRENDDLAIEQGGPDAPMIRFAHRTWRSEQRVLALHAQNAFAGTHFRYPRIYGPNQPDSSDWSIVKRVLDRRPYMILPDGGLQIDARADARNAAHCLLLGVDRPDVAAGQIYNCVEDEQFTWRQLLELVVDQLGGVTEMLSMPDAIAYPARVLTPMATASGHWLLDGSKARAQLGYRDIVPPRQAFSQQVAWLAANPPARCDRDPFDYAAEDRLIALWQDALGRVLREADFPLPDATHNYDHPTVPARN